MVKDKEETTDRSTRRIELMLYLLHQNPIEGLPSFLHGLSCHVASLLKAKEKTAFRADNWLYTEAAKPENISKAGTFRRVCIQYLESKISPILAGIIAHIDTNHNLDIIHNHITSGDWKARLWLHILNTPGAIQLQYSDLQSPTRQHELNEVVVKTSGCEGQMFTAAMPFSWLIFEQIDSIWRNVQESQEEEKMHMKVEKTVGLVKETKLGQQLETLEGSVSSEDIRHLHTQDFTKIVYRAKSSVEHEEKTSIPVTKNQKAVQLLGKVCPLSGQGLHNKQSFFLQTAIWQNGIQYLLYESPNGISIQLKASVAAKPQLWCSCWPGCLDARMSLDNFVLQFNSNVCVCDVYQQTDIATRGMDVCLKPLSPIYPEPVSSNLTFLQHPGNVP